MFRCVPKYLVQSPTLKKKSNDRYIITITEKEKALTLKAYMPIVMIDGEKLGDRDGAGGENYGCVDSTAHQPIGVSIYFFSLWFLWIEGVTLLHIDCFSVFSD